jgi:hypothetical protein
MLGKLLKYETKATARIFLPLYLALLLFAGINKLISALDPQKLHTPANISMVVYIIIMAGMFVMTFTVMIQRFYKNLLSDEGYLMHTLPVKPWKHILSKLLISMLWMLASVIMAILSVLIITYKKGALTEFFLRLGTIHEQILAQLGASGYLWVFEIILGALITLASGILIIYASIAIGHLFSRHKFVGSFGAFIVLNTLSQIYFMIANLIIKANHAYHLSIYNISLYDFSNYQFLVWYTFVVIGLQCAAYFAATNYILNKRLNLE